MTQPASDPMDMGADGQVVAKDAYGFTLHYFDESNNHDYSAIGTTQSFANALPSGFTSLFNGNIAAMNINVPKIGQPVLHSYKYDQLNRIKEVNNYNSFDVTNNTWQATQQHKEALTFDANGNIQTALLNGNNAQLTYENLNYNYDPVKKNRLLSITNSVNNTTSNYEYDESGNVTKDELEGNAIMDWNVYGKLSRVVKDDGREILFKYDATGNRIAKIIGAKEEWYVRDASGNIMATYLKDPAINSGKLSTESYYMYGSSMLGAWNHVTNMETTYPSQAIATFQRSEKDYYLGNQLNNNLVVLSDSKRGFDDNGDGIIDRYEADVLSATDYSAYGENLKGREFNSSGIKFGFNNKWNDFETGYQDYGMRMYSNKRRGFVSVDPLFKDYPFYSPYQFAGNTPIRAFDLDGLEITFSDVWNNRANVVDWLNDPSTWVKGAENINEAINPLYLANKLGYQIRTGKDYNTGKFIGRGKAVADAGVNVIMYLSGEKALGVFRYENAVERQTLENASVMGQWEKSAVQEGAQQATNAETNNTVTTSVQRKAAQFLLNKQNSNTSEAIVRDRLTKQLGANETILDKPRIYIGDGSSGKYSVPDFAVYNTKTGEIVRIIEAKNGNALPSRAQEQLYEFGGIFRGSSRAPDAIPQSIKPKMLEIERTNVGAGY